MSASARVISPRICPAWITTMRSARARISSSSLEISSTAMPRSAAARRRWPMNSIAPTSRPRHGWAATSTVGSAASSRASTTRCWLPPDSDANGASGPAQSMPNSAISVGAPAAAGLRGRCGPGRAPRPSSSSARFSATLSAEHAAGVVAVLGDQPDAGRRPSPRPARSAPREPSTSTLPASSGEQAAEHVGELGLAVALDAGDADDLAGVDVERQVVEDRADRGERRRRR